MSCCRDGTNSFLFYIPSDVLLPVPIMSSDVLQQVQIMFSDVIPQALLPVLSDAQCAIFLRMKFPGNGTSSEMSSYQLFAIITCPQVDVREATRGQAVQRKLPCSGPQGHFCKNYCTRVFISVMPDPWHQPFFVNHTAPARQVAGHLGVTSRTNRHGNNWLKDMECRSGR